jgi:hypothetical protein
MTRLTIPVPHLVLVAVTLALALAIPGSSEAAFLSQVKNLTASDAEASDLFGSSAAVSGDMAAVSSLEFTKRLHQEARTANRLGPLLPHYTSRERQRL